MNKNKTKAIVLAILGLIAAYVLYTRVFGESEEDRLWREQFEARESGQPAGPSETPAAAPTAAEPTAGSLLRQDEIDLDELAAGIKEVEFDYSAARREDPFRNPMAPLVGPYVAPAPAGQPATGEPLPADDEATLAAIRRNLRLSGIMWHPSDPAAIINNEVVPLGHEFPGETFRTARAPEGILETTVLVERITQDSVILKYKDSEIALELKER